MMDSRDEKTKFAHQTALHNERPEITPELVQQLHKNGRIIEAKSFNAVAKQSEIVVIFSAYDGAPIGVRMNPDIVVNLAVNLLKNGNKLGWFSAKVEDIDPPLPH